MVLLRLNTSHKGTKTQKGMRTSYVSRLPEDIVCVSNGVAVALFGEEGLAVSGKFLFAGIARDEGVKVGEAAIGFGAQYAPEALGKRWNSP